jgi:radical SAM superfamily enzyme YgiQ (UPF0313 family)
MAADKRITKTRRSHFLPEGESGAVYKDHGGMTRVCLVYPNSYRVGMSNLGFRLVYALLNARPDVVCERAFFEGGRVSYDGVRSAGHPAVSVESGTPLYKFDIVAFSVSFENDFPGVAGALLGAGIPLYARDRGERHPLVAMGGPCAFMNPEPMAEFMDVVFVGEAEALLDDFFALLSECRTRDELLERLCGMDGFYIPRAYKVDYGADGRIARITSSAHGMARPPYQAAVPSFTQGVAPPFTQGVAPPADGVLRRVRRRWADVLDADAAPRPPQLVARDTEFSGMRLVEVMRGCPWRCRFCAVSAIYRPIRMRGFSAVAAEVDDARACGERVGLLGASLTDYPRIGEVLGMEGVEFSISSVRASSKSAEILKAAGRRQSVSVAPETGSERLRKVINKNLARGEILDTCRLILESGASTLRLYFMVGLPTETFEDIEESIGLVRQIRALSLRGEIVVSISPFVPKPFTAFQWHPMLAAEAVKKRLRAFKLGLKGLFGVKVHHEVVSQAHKQGLFSMGGRRLSPVIKLIAEGRPWRDACRECGVDSNFYTLRPKGRDEIFPWDIIDNGAEAGGGDSSEREQERLWREYSNACGD